MWTKTHKRESEKFSHSTFKLERQIHPPNNWQNRETYSTKIKKKRTSEITKINRKIDFSEVIVHSSNTYWKANN